MRKSFILLLLPLVLAWGCNSDDPSATSTTEDSETTTTTSDTPVSMDVNTVPESDSLVTDPDATGTFMMMKLSVGDLEDAERFYGHIFGTKTAMTLGDSVHMVSFPDGGPGIILIESDDEELEQGAFIVQVPDLETAKARALEVGATEQQEFEGRPTGEVARSIDMLDPWGNQFELLQIG